jgi:hypothetical protein
LILAVIEDNWGFAIGLVLIVLGFQPDNIWFKISLITIGVILTALSIYFSSSSKKNDK